MLKKLKMSEKSIEYIEAIIYILAVIVVIFANVYGNIYIKMIPLLFVLGIVGNILFDRQIVTTTFGIVTSMCLIYLSMGVPLVENIFISFINGLQIILGECLGKYIKKAYVYSKSSKKISIKKKTRANAVMVLLIFLTIGMHMYINGSILAHSIAKNNLTEYLQKKDIKDFKIVNTKFNFIYKRNYQFLVLNNDNNITSKYTIYLNDIDLVIDEYANIIDTKKNTEIINKITTSIKENNMEQIYSKYTYKVQNNNLSQTLLCINKNVDFVDNNTKECFIEEIVEIIQILNKNSALKNIDILQISISSNDIQNKYIADIELSKYIENLNDDKGYKYIKDALDMQYIEF